MSHSTSQHPSVRISTARVVAIMAEEEKEQKVLMHFVNGVPVPQIVTQDLVDVLKTADYYSDDVWIATYPKTGTLWTAQIVRLIHNKGVQDDTVLPTIVP